jgi:hypothetical protein
MKLDPVKFSTRFGIRAAHLADNPSAQVSEEKVPQNNDSFVGRISHAISNLLSPRTAQAQVGLATRVAFETLGPATALALAQEVGVEFQAPGDPAGEAFLKKQADIVDGRTQPNQKMERVWKQIVAVTGTDAERPTLLADEMTGPGRFVGQRMFADGEAFGKLPDEVALFYTAHELGHIENSDGARKTGMTALAQELPNVSPTVLTEMRQEKDWEMEYRADERAAEIAAKAGCEPGPILLDLLTEPSGSQHPPGLERARRVRSVMAAHGQSVTDGQWSEWVESTASTRAERQQNSDDMMDWKLSFENLV